jgi:hypothetical protein
LEAHPAEFRRSAYSKHLRDENSMRKRGLCGIEIGAPSVDGAWQVVLADRIEFE